jgi:flagellar basal-body rod protein FlgC
MPINNNPTAAANVSMSIAASALKAQQSRMKVIAENIANAESTSMQPGGDPYRRQTPVFEPETVNGGGKGVEMTKVVPDETPFHITYDPGHPAADAKGYVKLSNVDPLTEALDMRSAQRAYEANLNVIETARNMQSRTLDILKK